jgi:hypothetical protein
MNDSIWYQQVTKFILLQGIKTEPLILM